ncbi:MAG: hypothetical protein GX273_08405 [Bacteroidales bacterium]|nr:hypothetical protein [Bacteroidales bacterium]
MIPLLLLFNLSCVNRNNNKIKTIESTVHLIENEIKAAEIIDVKKEANYQDSLIKAIKWNKDTVLIENYVKKGAEVNKRDETGIYPLYWAQYYSYEEVIKKLVNLGAIDFNKEVEDFLKYCKEGKIDSIKLLINNGFDINSYRVFYEESNEGGGCGCTCIETGLYNASKMQNIDLVRFLIDRGANVYLPDEALQPLEPAIKKRNFELAKLLINNGASKNVTVCEFDYDFAIYGPSYYNALNKADTVLLNFLLDNNFPYPDYLWDWSYGPLCIAVKKDDFFVVDNLLKISKNLKEINTAINFSKSEKMLRILLQNGAAINNRYSWAGEGYSGEVINPLYTAVTTEDIDYVNLLIKLGADPNILDADYNGNNHIYASYFTIGAPLIEAVSIGNMEIVKLLIKAGANVNFSTRKSYYIETENNKYGEYFVMWETPLTVAIRNNDKALVELLIKNGAKKVVHGDLVKNYKFEKPISPEILELLSEKK